MRFEQLTVNNDIQISQK